MVMLRHRIDLLVARSLDVASAREIEKMQAMRFVRQVSECVVCSFTDFFVFVCLLKMRSC